MDSCGSEKSRKVGAVPGCGTQVIEWADRRSVSMPKLALGEYSYEVLSEKYGKEGLACRREPSMAVLD